MLRRDEVLEIVQGAYEARVNGDKAALARCWAEGAHFEINGTSSLLTGVPLTGDRPMDAIEVLMDRFTFSDLELVDSVVEGNKLAARWRVTITTGEKPPVRTELFDLIELNVQGKIQFFRQFADTALIRHIAC